MKNRQIKNLDQPVPKEIRLQVYKEIINLYDSDSKRVYQGDDKRRYKRGLCILLPIVLWDIKDAMTRSPDNSFWWAYQTQKAFPELTEEHIQNLSKLEEGPIKNLKRYNLINQFINQLENEDI